ncbi:AraC family transcriptional regulator [Cohnella pontilimi]|uniref:AraC family transcriptional regulator n=1 Tax=Cohnella pontilimi TaxID=2564100 RepID=A0A4U0F7K1_9BACL|nr:AraC family transcriptional regulator [Cohnella pontilimi]TJY40653.1 AraC family transcriptional regulator [Cohnella pontilimi]
MDAAVFPVVTSQDALLPLYLTSIGHWDHQEAVRRPDGFPSYQWLQVLSGEGELEVGNRRFQVRPGQGFCLFPGVPHHYLPVKEPWRLYWISFDGGLSASLLGQAGIVRSGVYPVAQPDLPVSDMHQLLMAAQSGQPYSGFEYSKMLYSFLLDLHKVIQEGAPAAGRFRHRLQPALSLVEQELHRPIGIAELAEAVGMSPQHLCTLFRKTLHMRPMEYVNRERIKRSKELMFRESVTPIRDIAAKVGMGNPSYFSALFKKLEGISPEQFKQMHGLKM